MTTLAASGIREAHEAMIRINPVTVTFTRKTRVRLGGAFDTVESTHGPFTVRIHQEGSQQPMVLSDVGGSALKITRWGMLAGAEANLDAGSDVDDEFDAPGYGSFRITAVYPLRMYGELYGYQAELEHLS